MTEPHKHMFLNGGSTCDECNLTVAEVIQELYLDISELELALQEMGDEPALAHPGAHVMDVRERVPQVITFTGYFLAGQTSAEFISDLLVPGMLADVTMVIHTAEVRDTTLPEVVIHGRFGLDVGSKSWVDLPLVELEAATALGHVRVAARQGFGVRVSFPPARRAGSLVVVLRGEVTRDMV